ncbi:Lrp/AsnC family transcriptional regulator [Thermoproteus tenax]|uniref:Transcriptional regulator, AsnC family n=1 Tax=Thermoproteus tenax (strain ATCC 35583 / DSM 2078 / JCM 9277 / NBRC 100435 / Kra 1) TaxID=768679 RepID=G4RME4_THETK|nr:Lrp/AsnC ligand binding domain-containing protein [Thermoproteus tenax]CCC80775.1 transcriptional regulator, AsnC family [Thermoproteus tenax Kra 1]
MVEAFVFINTDIGAEDEVLEALTKMPEVKEAMIVYGPYDLVVRIATDTTENLRKIVSDKIRRMQKIRSTTTLIIAKSIIK